MCYRPEEKDVITVIYAPISPLIANKHTVEFQTNDSLQEITLTNSSLTKTAYNVNAQLKDPLLNSLLIGIEKSSTKLMVYSRIDDLILIDLDIGSSC